VAAEFLIDIGALDLPPGEPRSGRARLYRPAILISLGDETQLRELITDLIA